MICRDDCKIIFLASAASVHSHKWVGLLSSSAYKIYWISTHENNVGKISSNVNYLEFTKGGAVFRFFQALCALYRLSAAGKVIIHVHYIGYYALLAYLRPARRLVLTAWGSDVLINSRSFLKRVFLKLALARALLVTYDGGNMKKRLLDLGCSSNKLLPIRFGVDTRKFCKKAHAEDFGVIKLISLRNHERIYDIETLLKAVKLLYVRGFHIKLSLYGTGYDSSRLNNIKNNLGLESVVNFYGRYEYNELPSILKGNDIYISTSLSDSGLSSSTAEAMACGLAVVITDVGENSMWVKDGVSGKLFVPSNANSCAEAIQFFIENSASRIECGRVAKNLMRHSNDMRIEAAKMKNAYEGVFAHA
ncbi:hypothetical protein OTERR_25590 [Oryzomicrobium terrae]|uniref:Glycosyl transferase family 1 domain-containing protein n=1 Tax=Oryzomicrobium terrae TaxID=1735038 RepID=A0A5C1EBB3_9RHOO|nr:hypothetical protein OTERR_25590 [Oryzomicrobium terrae]